jgi:hypothetical protein
MFGLKLQKVRSFDKSNPIPLVASAVDRLIHFNDLLGRIAGVEGDIVECGVGWGRSLFAFAALSAHFEQERHIYGHDSFSGFPEPTPEDDALLRGISAGRYTTNEVAVTRYLRNSGIEQEYIDANMTLVPGFFSETLSGYNGVVRLHCCTSTAIYTRAITMRSAICIRR